jgi:predicted transcriptional regulator
MLEHMRTTLNIDDDLMKRVKQRASETGTTITEVMEEALRAAVAGDAPGKTTFSLAWKPIAGRTRPGIDVADRDSLYEAMERPDDRG